MTQEPWHSRTPDLIADVKLYPAVEDGRRSAALLGYGCPCFTAKDTAVGGWDARLQLGDQPFEPGSQRRVGFVFLVPEGAEAMRRAGRFFLWEGRFVGEASVVT
jgi:hypothetical protein